MASMANNNHSVTFYSIQNRKKEVGREGGQEGRWEERQKLRKQ